MARQGADALYDDEISLTPHTNVYSFFTFSRPIDKHRNPTAVFTVNDFLASFLVMLNVTLQSLILWAIFHHVIGSDIEWRNEVISPQTECHTGRGLCRFSNGTYTCAPASVQLFGRYQELDPDNDGIWQFEEVEQERDKFECLYAVDLMEVFNVFLSVINDADPETGLLSFVPPIVKAGRGIPKAYFDWAKPKIIFCTYGYETLCPNLLERGIWDVPLKTGKFPWLGKTADSVLSYCTKELMKDGFCERHLPSSYSVWKQTSLAQCKAPMFSNFTYLHPTTGAKKSLLKVDYQAVADYAEGAQTPMFFAYKTIIILLFVLAIYPEAKLVLTVLTFTLTFPSENDVDKPVEEVRDEEGSILKYTINGISKGHRIAVFCMCVSRMIFLGIIAYVGVIFLCSDLDYINLLMNAVGLAFVLEIATVLYSQVLGSDIREEFESIEPFTIRMEGWKCLWIKNSAMRDLIGLFFVIIAVVTTMCLYHNFVVRPVATALECTCLSQGEHCREAQEFGKDFWSKYFTHDFPEILASIEAMKQEHAAGGNQIAASLQEISKETSGSLEAANETLSLEAQLLNFLIQPDAEPSSESVHLPFVTTKIAASPGSLEATDDRLSLGEQLLDFIIQPDAEPSPESVHLTSLTT